MRLTADESRKILELASEKQLDMEVFEGTLNDSYIIYNNKALQVDGQTPNYIIMLDKYINVWQSEHELILTDSDQKFDEVYQELSRLEMTV
ncbi:hypothetical protein EVJ32_04660 [Exiguobacterium sp. SH5S4]|uniref:hypothetical protein n=1 Tax=Exiguobacterium sp. SH5S4 TaxID=2510961 RepID=UPI00103DD371|nr:hypothetical protein [Exiguobacterium sp. SH5S4]TCI26669.1 hypothetical protein EVJ32_04660 [Exiguobacterium sp. SH5S4]